MNKNLLLGSALLVAISVYPQAGRQKPTGFINKQALNQPIDETKAVNSPVKSNLVKPMPRPLAAKTASTPATSCVHISGSANAFGGYQGGHEVLQYNADVNAISFVHRCSPTYTSIPNGNTGVLVAKYSANQGTTWDSTVIYASTLHFGRYPAGIIYNPLGNTNINNAYIVATGETHPGANWDGSHFSSKKITTPGTNVPGTDMQWFPSTTPFVGAVKKVDFARYGSTYTKDGLIRFYGSIVNDPNGTTAPAYQAPRGEAIIKGTFVAGAFVWSYDSLVPACITRTGGSKQITENQAMMAWNDAGTVGYAIMNGVRAGATGSKKGYQPIIYKTTNSGASWSLMPQQDFLTPQFKGLVDRLWSTAASTNVTVPFFSQGEGNEAAVDVNDNLHIVTTVVGAYSTHQDSLEYTGSFGTEKYSFPYGGFGYPTIYDFYTTTAGGWNYHIVDSMYTEGPAGASGGGGFATNPWATGAVPLDARIQVAFSPDRKKLFYSWTMTDTSTVGNLHWNAYPDLYMRGFDVTIDKITKRQNVTGGVTTPSNADQSAYMHYMSNRAIVTNSVIGVYEIPFTITYNNTSDGNVPVNHYYLKGASFQNSDFNGTPFRPVGVQALANTTPSYEVVAYPNPASGSTTISVKLKEVKNFEINVYNTVGALVQTMNLNGQIGNNDVTLDISKLSAGVYFYNVKADNSVITNKLIVE